MSETRDLLVSFPPLIVARYQSRPHRFCVRCVPIGEPDGAEVSADFVARLPTIVDAHLADPGRLLEVLVPDRLLYLRGPYPPPRKLAWSVVMAECDGTLVSLDATLPNKLGPMLVRRGLFPELVRGELKEVRTEVRVGKSRLDLAVEGTEGTVFAEIKGVGLRRGERGEFPDAPTKRGQKHVRTLTELARAGQQAALVFIAGRADVSSFGLARDIDPDFARAVVDAVDAGVQVVAAAVELSAKGAREAVRLPVCRLKSDGGDPEA